MDNSCMIPSSLFEPSVLESEELEREVVRLWRLQSDTMKQAIIDVMKSTIGEEWDE